MMQTMPSTEAVARSGTYQLLARLWLREVDRDLARELSSPPLSDFFVAAGGVLPLDDDDETFEQLAIEYCRLFIGPTGHLPPYQSVWQSGQFQGTTTASMETFIDVACYDIAALPSGIMLDHLGVQLDVMAHILGQFSTSKSEPAIHECLPELAQRFFATHLMWPTELLEAASRRAKTGFYCSMIMLTRGFLDSEMQA
jgi:TorA maturation chaperone TorD